MKGILGVIIVLALMFFGVEFYRGTYTPPENRPTTEPTTESQDHQVVNHNLVSVTCAIIVSNSQTKSGEKLGRFRLLRPVGEILASSLLSAGKNSFKSVQLVTSMKEAEGRDVIIDLRNWEIEDTKYDFSGIPLLIGSSTVKISLSVITEITGVRIEQQYVMDSATGTLISDQMLFPALRLTNTFTETIDLAALTVAKKIMERVVSKILPP